MTKNEQTGATSAWDLFLPLALCIAATHGFGYFLFPALLPTMRLEHGLSYATTANITAGAQIAYMGGSLFAGVMGPKFGAGRLALASTVVPALCLLAMSVAGSSWTIGILVAAMSASAAINWTSISALGGVFIPERRRGMVLTVAATGSAWGVCANGVLVSQALPAWTSSDAWKLVGIVTLIISVITGVALARRGALGDPRLSVVATKSNPGDAIGREGHDVRRRATRYIYLFSLLAGFTAVPYLTYLGAYLETEVGNPAALVGSVWSVLGITGAITGFAVGWAADRFGIPRALRGLFAAFIIGALVMVFLPIPPVIYGAGIGFGLMYFTLWGLLSTYINQFLAPGPAMRLVGISLVCVSAAAAVGNWAAGQWASLGHSFVEIYAIIAMIGCVMVVLTFTMPGYKRGDSIVGV